MVVAVFWSIKAIIIIFFAQLRIQRYAHPHRFNFRRAGQQGPTRTLTAADCHKTCYKTVTGHIFYHASKILQTRKLEKSIVSMLFHTKLTFRYTYYVHSKGYLLENVFIFAERRFQRNVLVFICVSVFVLNAYNNCDFWLFYKKLCYHRRARCFSQNEEQRGAPRLQLWRKEWIFHLSTQIQYSKEQSCVDRTERLKKHLQP